MFHAQQQRESESEKAGEQERGRWECKRVSVASELLPAFCATHAGWAGEGVRIAAADDDSDRDATK